MHINDSFLFYCNISNIKSYYFISSNGNKITVSLYIFKNLVNNKNYNNHMKSHYELSTIESN